MPITSKKLHYVQLPFPGFEHWLMNRIIAQRDRLSRQGEAPAKAQQEGNSSRRRRLDRLGTINRAVGREVAGGTKKEAEPTPSRPWHLVRRPDGKGYYE